MNLIQASHVIDTPLGPLTVLASDAALVAARFDAAPGGLPSNTVCEAAQAQVVDYFDGRRQRFSVPLDPVGTPFQRTVWQALGEVAWGQRVSYSGLADSLDRAGAYRAVGAAVGRNPLALFIPCHRVLGVDGRLIGFAWGLERKRALLALEGFHAAA